MQTEHLPAPCRSAARRERRDSGCAVSKFVTSAISWRVALANSTSRTRLPQTSAPQLTLMAPLPSNRCVVKKQLEALRSSGAQNAGIVQCRHFCVGSMPGMEPLQAALVA